MERLIYRAWMVATYWFVEFSLGWTFGGGGVEELENGGVGGRKSTKQSWGGGNTSAKKVCFKPDRRDYLKKSNQSIKTYFDRLKPVRRLFTTFSFSLQFLCNSSHVLMQICSIICLFAQQRNGFQNAKKHGSERCRGSGSGATFYTDMIFCKMLWHFWENKPHDVSEVTRYRHWFLKKACFSVCLKGVEVPQAESSQKNEM